MEKKSKKTGSEINKLQKYSPIHTNTNTHSVIKRSNEDEMRMNIWEGLQTGTILYKSNNTNFFS